MTIPSMDLTSFGERELLLQVMNNEFFFNSKGLEDFATNKEYLEVLFKFNEDQWNYFSEYISTEGDDNE